MTPGSSPLHRRSARSLPLAVAATAALAVACVSGSGGTAAGASASTQLATASGPSVQASTPERAGEYLTIVGGCNDCHTPNWAETNGNTTPRDRLVGSSVGYRGPWGTTYPANLRMFASRVSEDRWVEVLRTAAGGHGQPPMPWMNTRQMSESDLRAMYRYVHALGPAGERTPRRVPPDSEPTTPYIWMVPRSSAR